MTDDPRLNYIVVPKPEDDSFEKDTEGCGLASNIVMMLKRVYDHSETHRVCTIYIRIIRTVTTAATAARSPLGFLRILQESFGWNDTCQYL
jgi:hypothetical protein